MHKASGGKSFGNIRGQHNPKIAAGLLKSIEFDDEAKRIDFCAKIVDDQEWAKVEEGVYTGFSPGGSYAKRWPDGGYHRYTPEGRRAVDRRRAVQPQRRLHAGQGGRLRRGSRVRHRQGL
jgi:hypothetical protein